MHVSQNVKTITTLLAASMLLLGCATSNQPINVPNEAGGYLAPKDSPFYQSRGGVLFAFDGKDWYQLLAPEVDAGLANGAAVGSPEQWIKAGGDRNQKYMRTNSTFMDQTKQPVFLAY